MEVLHILFRSHEHEGGKSSWYNERKNECFFKQQMAVIINIDCWTVIWNALYEIEVLSGIECECIGIVFDCRRKSVI